MPTIRKRATDPLAERLRALAENRPDLHDAAEAYAAILPLLRDAAPRMPGIALAPEEALARTGKGIPLLHDLSLEIDGQEASALMLSLASALEKSAMRDRGPKVAAGKIRQALEKGQLDAGALLSYCASGLTGMVNETSRELGLDDILLQTLLRNSLKPFLRQARLQLGPLISDIPAWQRSYCPVCGAPALLGEFQDNNQAKHLRCGHCGSDWPVRRLRCACCASEDHTALHFLYAETGREQVRVEVCDACRGYLKVVTAFTPLSPEMLLVEDLASLHLDSAARERGYARTGTLSMASGPGQPL